MEASALPPSVAIARTRLALGAPLLRFRSDEQLVSLFRYGSEEAFRAIHDRYRQRMFAYTRQMLSGSAVDAEDAVQEIFVRAYSGLRASDRELALRAWLYRIAHNRCIDERRRPQSVATEVIPATVPNTGGDPVARVEQRDALQRLIADVQRLPDQQRSALLMRELAGMTYADVAGALGVSVPAVKSLLVRARVGLAQASEARDTACTRIREDLIVAHDRGVRASGLARRHLRDCPHCRQFRSEVRGVSRQLAAFVPALGPIGVVAKLLGIGGASGGGAAAGSSAIAGGTATAATATATATAGGLAGTGAVAGVGALAGGHVVTLLAAAVVTAGGAIELQHIAPPAPHRVHHHHAAANRASARTAATASSAVSSPSSTGAASAASSPQEGSASAATSSGQAANPFAPAASTTPAARHRATGARRHILDLPLSETIDPDHWDYLYGISGGANGLANPANPSGSSTTPPGSSTSSPTAGSPSSASPAGVTPPTSATGAPTATPSTGAAPTTATGAAPSTGTSAGTGTSAASSSGTTGSTSSTGSTSPGSAGTAGSTTSTGSAGQAGRSRTTVTPAASTGSIDPTKQPATSKLHGHGTIAVFTMTGN
ncbi:MAG: sigma-70 family RNA polymerase sigma factor [Solirubrobacteraceae bacterium]